MRDINRMDPFLAKIKNEWSKAPDLRFGQLMSNFFTTGDPFYWEEDEFIERLGRYLDSLLYMKQK